MDKYIISKTEIEAYNGIDKVHFLNSNARRTNKSLGDLTGLQAIGFHIIEVPVGYQSTELHKHYHEEECVYILQGTAQAIIGDESFQVNAGDFIGYRADGEAHTLINNGDEVLRCIVVGQRSDHDIADYPDKGKRLYRGKGLAWNLVDIDQVVEPVAGKKA